MSSTRQLLFAGTVALSVVLQTAVLPVFLDIPFRPDLLLIIVVFLALRGSFEAGIPLAWLLGVCKDVFSGLYLGLNALTFLIIFLIIKSVAERLYAESGFLFVITVVAASLACVSGNFLLLLLFTKTEGIAATMAVNIVPHLLINAFTAALVTLVPNFFSVEDTP